MVISWLLECVVDAHIEGFITLPQEPASVCLGSNNSMENVFHFVHSIKQEGKMDFVLALLDIIVFMIWVARSAPQIATMTQLLLNVSAGSPIWWWEVFACLSACKVTTLMKNFRSVFQDAPNICRNMLMVNVNAWKDMNGWLMELVFLNVRHLRWGDKENANALLVILSMWSVSVCPLLARMELIGMKPEKTAFLIVWEAKYG